jgi:hypothetical protein
LSVQSNYVAKKYRANKFREKKEINVIRCIFLAILWQPDIAAFIWLLFKKEFFKVAIISFLAQNHCFFS